MVETDTITAGMISAASEAYAAFETATRDPGGDGEEYYVRLKDEIKRDTWIYQAVRDAHGKDPDGSPSMLPDDYRYRWTRDAFAAISDAGEGDDADDLRHEFADGTVDDYSGDRLKWLASNLNRPAYCDEALEEFGGSANERGGILSIIGLGQYMEAREVFDSILQSIAEHLDSGA